jgi:hypothetical protein
MNLKPLEKRLTALENAAGETEDRPVATFAWWRSLGGILPVGLAGPLGAVVERMTDRRAAAVATLQEFAEGDQDHV